MIMESNLLTKNKQNSILIWESSIQAFQLSITNKWASRIRQQSHIDTILETFRKEAQKDNEPTSSWKCYGPIDTHLK